MEIYQLRSFVTIAREKHLTRGAEKLNVSQPAASAHIKALEEELGLFLFQRTPKGMQLTEPGRPLYEMAKQILRQADEFIHFGETLASRPTGTVRIGLNRNAEFLRVQPLYQLLRSDYPGLEIILRQSISGTILKLLQSDELDCGFVLGHCKEEGLEGLELARFQLRVVGPVQLREKIQGADIGQLAALPWIGIPTDCPYNWVMEHYFHAAGYHPQAEVVADQQSAITSMVESGAGLNFMLEAEALQAEKEGRVAVWEGEGFPIGLSFVHRTVDKQSVQIRAVRKSVLAVWAKAVPSPEDEH